MKFRNVVHHLTVALAILLIFSFLAQAQDPPPVAPVAPPAPATPASPATPAAPAASDPAAAILNVLDDTNAPNATADGTNDVAQGPKRRVESRPPTQWYPDIVRVGSDVVLKAGETCHNVVVVGGSATIDGTVTGDLIVVSGSLVLNGKVNRDVVAVLSPTKIGADAVTKRHVHVIGGELTVHPDAKLNGQPVEVSPKKIPLLAVATDWLSKGLFYARPLPHQFSWAWAVAGVFLMINLLLSLLFPRPIQACVDGIESRPIGSFFTGILVLVLFVPATVLLTVSTVGVFVLVIPFLLCAMAVSFLLGKVVVYRYAGQQLGKQMHLGFLQTPLLALVAGTGIFYLLYIIPVIGFLAWGVMSAFGLGAVVLTAASNLRRENERANPTGMAPGTVDPASLVMPNDATTFPRAGFWIRVGAVLLDAVIFIALTALIRNPPIGLLAWCGYHVGMWAWKGTTIGGIVTGIKIVRTDGREIDFTVALVRFLSSFVSLVVLLIGFFWAGWSREKRSWHDIIAGTMIVKVPKGLSLI